MTWFIGKLVNKYIFEDYFFYLNFVSISGSDEGDTKKEL